MNLPVPTALGEGGNCSSLQKQCSQLDARVTSLEHAYKRRALPPSSSATLSNLFQKSMHSSNNSIDAMKGNTMSPKNAVLNDFIRHGGSTVGASGYAQKSLTSTMGERSNLLLPPATRDVMQQLEPDYSPFRKIARVTYITTDTLEVLIDRKNGDVGWVSETDARNETEAPELLKTIIPTHELFARPRASQKLLDDAGVDVEKWLSQKIAWQMGMMETEAFVKGDGKGKPRGFLTYDTTTPEKEECGKVVTFSSGDEGTLMSSDVLIDVMHSMKVEYLTNACWVMSRQTLSIIRKLKDKDGQYLWLQNNMNPAHSTLLGYSVVLCDAMPHPEKDNICIVFGNFEEAYHIVDRQDVHILRDPYSAKPYVEFYATKRIGGDVMRHDALRFVRF